MCAQLSRPRLLGARRGLWLGLCSASLLAISKVVASAFAPAAMLQATAKPGAEAASPEGVEAGARAPAPSRLESTVVTAEGLLLLGKSSGALSTLTALSPEERRQVDAQRITAWALLGEERSVELRAALAQTELNALEGGLLSALAQRSRGREAAAAALRALWWEAPDTVWGLAALRELAETASLLPAEREALRQELSRATVRTHLDDDALVSDHLESLRRALPRTSALTAELDYALGVCELRHERSESAASRLQAALAASPDAPPALRRAITGQLAEAERRLGSYDAARHGFAELAADGSDSWGTRARAALGQLAIEQRQYSEAEHLFRSQLLDNPIGEARSAALWGLGWVAWRTGSLKQARRFFLTLATEAPYGTLAPSALYWAARCLEDRGEIRQARAELAALIERFPADYYAYQADKLLRGASVMAAALPEPPRHAELTRLESLVRTGAERRARALLARITTDQRALGRSDLQLLERLAARLGAEGQRHLVQDQLCERYPTALDCKEQRAIYTGPAATTLMQLARPTRLAPDLLLAVGVQASGLDATRLGPHGELGLLQVPRTALRDLWREQHGRSKRVPELREIQDADRDLQLSARYTGRLLRGFAGHLEYGLAALRAGPGAVTRWRASFGELPGDIFVEEIPYPETAAWVRQVLARLRTVQLLSPPKAGATVAQLNPLKAQVAGAY
jgi:Tfp pilus assembly protein PilF